MSEVYTVQATAIEADIEIKEFGRPIVSYFLFSFSLDYILGCSCGSITGGKELFAKVFGWYCCSVCPDYAGNTARIMVKIAFYVEAFLLGLGVVSFAVGYNHCSSSAARVLSGIGLYMSLCYVFYTWILIVFVYLPICFIYSLKLALYYDAQHDKFCHQYERPSLNKFFQISVNLKAVSASRIECNLPDSTKVDVTNLRGAEVGSVTKIMIYGDRWWCRYLVLTPILGFFFSMCVFAFFAFEYTASSSDCSSAYGTAIGVSIGCFAFYAGGSYLLISCECTRMLLSALAKLFICIAECLCLNRLRNSIEESIKEQMATKNPLNP